MGEFLSSYLVSTSGETRVSSSLTVVNMKFLFLILGDWFLYLFVRLIWLLSRAAVVSLNWGWMWDSRV